jgi:catechol 2,3-dioxygenase-like lactoylglutathione lyase family enzyme
MAQNTPPSQGIRHIALNVRDILESEDFYCRILGFKLEWKPDPENVYLTSGSDNLALHASKTKVQPSGFLDHFGLLVQRPEHVDEWAEYLKGHKIPLIAEPKTHRDGARSLYLKDPNDIMIQIIYHPPISNR